MSEDIQKHWSELIRPDRIRIEHGDDPQRFATFVAEPFERGFGMTIGNALRRTLLSVLRGAAITSVRVEGVLHEFSSIPGVREDMSDVILNLKSLVVRMDGTGVRRIRLRCDGPVTVTAGMIDTGHGVTVINPDHVICTLDNGASIAMEMTVETGKAFQPAAPQRDGGNAIGVINIDATFSPVRNVSFRVENAREGQVLDYDRLTLSVETNGVLRPEDAVAYAARIVQEQLQFYINFEEPKPQSSDADIAMTGFNRNLLRRVEELELSVRSANCLKNDNIIYIGDLIRKSEADMLRTPNFGRKSLNEIKEVLQGMGLHLGMDVPGWPPDNIEEMIRKIDETP